MTKTMKDASTVKHSSHTATLFHDTEANLSALSLLDIQEVLIQVFERLHEKAELHIHFIVNNGNNYGCMIGGNNEGSLTNQYNERGNNIQGNDNSINSVNVSGNDNSTNSVSGNDNSINSSKLSGVN
ncbi:hypothetical protein EZS27_004726 [termite gut metagenome]|uniref:Uncharacterized protein n=1 Tax=termite gut metagenome TaxID=433724 RepID=A0A5J4SR30_9ZZZZ